MMDLEADEVEDGSSFPLPDVKSSNIESMIYQRYIIKNYNDIVNLSSYFLNFIDSYFNHVQCNDLIDLYFIFYNCFMREK